MFGTNVVTEIDYPLVGDARVSVLKRDILVRKVVELYINGVIWTINTRIAQRERERERELD